MLLRNFPAAVLYGISVFSEYNFRIVQLIWCVFFVTIKYTFNYTQIRISRRFSSNRANLYN